MIPKRTASNPQTRSTGISRFLSLPSNAMKGLRVNGVKGRRCRSNGSICGVPIAKCLPFIAVIGISLTFTVVSHAQEYNEAPMLAKLVKQGKLPPVEERLPENPLVLNPPEIGVRQKLNLLSCTTELRASDKTFSIKQQRLSSTVRVVSVLSCLTLLAC